MIEFLTKLVRKTQRPLTIILDNHPAHKAGIVKSYAQANDLTLLFMPPYSCQFNSQERVWANVKREYRRLIAIQTDRITKEVLRAVIRQVAKEVNVT